MMFIYLFNRSISHNGLQFTSWLINCLKISLFGLEFLIKKIKEKEKLLRQLFLALISVSVDLSSFIVTKQFLSVHTKFTGK